MAEIDGGGLSFTSELDNEQLNAAIEETMRRIQGFSDAVVESGSTLDTTTQDMIIAARNTLVQVGEACAQHEQELERLGNEYDNLASQMSDALQAGRDEEVASAKAKMDAIQGEMKVREQLLEELREQSNLLDEEVSKMEQSAIANEKTADKHKLLRTRIRDLKEEMAAMIADGIDEQSEAYKALVNELGRLQDIQGDISQQGKILANDENQFAGMMSGLQGVVGGFTAAQGAVSLFAGESENLQKVMLKVQSLMSITMGLQQVAQMLNKDSAFQLVTLNGLKAKWNALLAIGRGEQAASTATTAAETAATVAETAAETANTAATQANTNVQAGNTAATGANAVATTAQGVAAAGATAANITLAGAIRMVGAAIKSIPGIGWILAAISGLVALVAGVTKKTREARKEQEQFNKELVNNVYKPIASIGELANKWNALANDLEAKKKFIDANKKSFDDLGVAVNDVYDAENLLVNNKDAFIQAQIEKAKSMVLLQQAQDKVKELMGKELQYSSMPDVKTVAQGNGYGGFMSYEVVNKEKETLGNEIKGLRTEIEQMFSLAADAETNGWSILKNAGIQGANTYADGTVGAIEQAISSKQAELKNLSLKKDYDAKIKEIEALQKQLDAITGGDKKKSDDPFLDSLNKKKSEYQRFLKWINSGDKILAEAATNEFSSLLSEGATYMDYLKNQREQILSVDIANRTAEQNQQLRQLNDSIAEETRKTVLETFNNELSEQLSNAKTVMEMLNIIEQKRKELSGDGSEMDNAKNESLDDAEQQAKAKQAQQTEALLTEYASYIAKKKAIDEQYLNDLALLQAQKAKASTDEERQEIEAAMRNRANQYAQDSKTSGNEDYDEMLQEYGTFEQKKQNIIDEYDEKRRVAQEMGNAQLVEQLNNAQAKALSKLANEELTGSETWSQLFGNLDELTAGQIDILVQEIETKFESLSGIFNPIDLQEIRNKLNEAKSVLLKDNPFKQMGESLKAIFGEAGDDSKKSADEIKRNWKKLGESTEASFNFVVDAVNSCDVLKDAIGDVGATALSSMMACATTAVAVATAIKTAEKASVILGIIQAALVVVQAVVNVVKSIAGDKDKEFEKKISEWKSKVDDLKNAYTQLSWEIERTLGSAIYNQQKEAIKNLEKQQQAYLAMYNAEMSKSKKNRDEGKAKEYMEQYHQAGRDIQDSLQEITDDILQTTAKDFSNELGGALADAFARGEDAAKAFEQTVNDVLKNAILNQLMKNFLETQLQGALDGLQNSMGYWDGDDFVFDGLTDEEIAAFRDKVKVISDNYNEALGAYKDVFKDLDSDKDVSLSGAVKGISEETASVVAGQMNAIRINQLESAEMLRQSLQTLNTIAVNTKYLQRIERIITLMETSADLRSSGLS